MKRIAAVVAAVSLAFVGTSTAFAAELNVCPSGCAYSSIQDAIDSAATGDVINVAAGTYTEHDLKIEGKSITIQGTVQGGVLMTTIDATSTRRVMEIKGGAAADTIIQNLILENGHTHSGEWNGGGVWVNNNAKFYWVTIRNCTAYNYGGGVFITGASPYFQNCTITGNTSEGLGYAGGNSRGGGIYMSDSSTSIINCTISDNILPTPNLTQSPPFGAGIYSSGGSQPEITGCKITGNSAGHGGSNGGGGGISCNNSSTNITDCVISNNLATYGAGVYNGDGSVLYVTNCTLSDNEPGANLHNAEASGGLSGPGDGYFRVEDSTICGHGDHIVGMIHFVGDNNIHDCLNNGDIDGDGDVDVHDLDQHHALVGICMSDVNHDFATDVLDLLVVIEGWGSVCP